MISVRIKKALKDLLIDKLKTFLTILSIALGIFGVGCILVALSILSREININYMQTNPAYSTIKTEIINEDLIKIIKNEPYIDEIEVTNKIIGRIEVNDDEWMPIWLFVVKDFDNIKINKFTKEKGKWPLKSNEIMIELAAIKGAKTDINKIININIPGNEDKQFKVSGIVHAPGLAPAWMEGLVYGFINDKTLQYLEINPDSNYINMTFKTAYNKKEIKKNTVKISNILKTNNISTFRTIIPEPGKHPHARQLNSLLFMLQMLGLLTLFLSCILVINMISSLMSRQIKQIGIMKVLGGNTFQVSSIYFMIVLILGFLGLLIGIPIGVYIGNLYAGFTAAMLNFNITSNYIPIWVFAVQIIIGLLGPVIASLIPILKGSSIKIYDALNDHGISTKNYGKNIIERILSKLSFISRPIQFSIRNTFRKKKRFILTLFTLALGGAIFMVSMNFRSSIRYTLTNFYKSKGYDINIRLNDYYKRNEIEKLLSGINGVKKVYTVAGVDAAVIKPDGSVGDTTRIIAVPENTKLFNLDIIEGHWFKEENTIVVNKDVVYHAPFIKTNDYVNLNIDGKVEKFKVSGIANELLPMSFIYMNLKDYNRIFNTNGLSNEFLIITEKKDIASHKATAKNIELALKKNDIDIVFNNQMSYSKKILEDHLVVIFVFILFMAVLIILVGGLSLMSTTSINVIDRIREIGIMRSIGASPFKIMRIIIFESIFVGILSWFLAVLIAPPLSILGANIFGTIFFNNPLDFFISSFGIISWMGFVIILSIIASFYPAFRATKIPVRKTLNYE